MTSSGECTFFRLSNLTLWRLLEVIAKVTSPGRDMKFVRSTLVQLFSVTGPEAATTSPYGGAVTAVIVCSSQPLPSTGRTR